MASQPESATRAKAGLRARVQAARDALPDDERTAAGSALRDTLLQEPRLEMAGTVALYYSVGSEPDTHKLLAGLWKRGTYVLLPVCRTDGQLDWAAYEGPQSMAPARFGLLEPTGPALGVDALRRTAAVVCPALAVDHAGNRLGKGAGYYDRALSHVGPHTPVIAVIYDTELLERVPAESHDRPVQAVARPTRGLQWLNSHAAGEDPADR